jgi:hypothetical protein
VHTDQLYFNLVRPNSHKEDQSLWQIIERLAHPNSVCFHQSSSTEVYSGQPGQASQKQLSTVPSIYPKLGGSAKGYNAAHSLDFALDQRARAAFCAISFRCSGESFLLRAFPPFCPNATALGSLSFLFFMFFM